MNINNIEKCQMLIEKRERLQKASGILAVLQRKARVTIEDLASPMGSKVSLIDEDLNLVIQDAIDARIQAIEKRIETL